MLPHTSGCFPACPHALVDARYYEVIQRIHVWEGEWDGEERKQLHTPDGRWEEEEGPSNPSEASAQLFCQMLR